MDRRDLDKKIKQGFKTLQKGLPIKTGNMAFNATQLKGNEYGYLIEIKDTIAPYAKEINRPGWRSYRFWDKAVEKYMKDLAKNTKGKLTKGGS